MMLPLAWASSGPSLTSPPTLYTHHLTLPPGLSQSRAQSCSRFQRVGSNASQTVGSTNGYMMGGVRSPIGGSSDYTPSAESSLTSFTTLEQVPAMISKAGTKDRLYKTTMCAFFAQGKCTRGDSCVYAHADLELRGKPDLFKTQLCRAWQRKGSCERSTNCNFAHGEQELRSNFNTAAGLQAFAQQHSAQQGNLAGAFLNQKLCDKDTLNVGPLVSDASGTSFGSLASKNQVSPSSASPQNGCLSQNSAPYSCSAGAAWNPTQAARVSSLDSSNVGAHFVAHPQYPTPAPPARYPLPFASSRSPLHTSITSPTGSGVSTTPPPADFSSNAVQKKLSVAYGSTQVQQAQSDEVNGGSTSTKLPTKRGGKKKKNCPLSVGTPTRSSIQPASLESAPLNFKASNFNSNVSLPLPFTTAEMVSCGMQATTTHLVDFCCLGETVDGGSLDRSQMTRQTDTALCDLKGSSTLTPEGAKTDESPLSVSCSNKSITSSKVSGTASTSLPSPYGALNVHLDYIRQARNPSYGRRSDQVVSLSPKDRGGHDDDEMSVAIKDCLDSVENAYHWLDGKLHVPKKWPPQHRDSNSSVDSVAMTHHIATARDRYEGHLDTEDPENNHKESLSLPIPSKFDNGYCESQHPHHLPLCDLSYLNKQDQSLFDSDVSLASTPKPSDRGDSFNYATMPTCRSVQAQAVDKVGRLEQSMKKEAGGKMPLRSWTVKDATSVQTARFFEHAPFANNPPQCPPPASVVDGFFTEWTSQPLTKFSTSDLKLFEEMSHPPQGGEGPLALDNEKTQCHPRFGVGEDMGPSMFQIDEVDLNSIFQDISNELLNGGNASFT
eukprot:GHVN01066394.1.p1 GENE.GHVN01066394.1~~GHVN01066394.1.p1  ORF type:complete len:833 (+),score=97.34 GHVN01066394.1:3703-6201(+)